MKIILPFRTNFQEFFYLSIGRIGITGGIAGKCVWLYFSDSTSLDFKDEIEEIESFYSMRQNFK